MMMTMTDKDTRAELVKHRNSREASLAELYRQADADESIDYRGDERDELDNYALGVSLQHQVRIDISTGGPAEWLIVDVDRANWGGWEIAGAVEFHYADWGTHDYDTVADDSALYRYAEECVEAMGDAS